MAFIPLGGSSTKRGGFIPLSEDEDTPTTIQKAEPSSKEPPEPTFAENFMMGGVPRVGKALAERAAHAMLPDDLKSNMELLAKQDEEAAKKPPTTLGEDIKEIGSEMATGLGHMVTHPWQSAKAMAAMTLADPWLLALPQGYLVKLGAMAKNTGQLGVIAAKTGGAAVEAGGMMAGLEGVAQTAEMGPYRPKAMATQFGMGAVLGGPIQGIKEVAGLRKGKKAPETPPEGTNEAPPVYDPPPAQETLTEPKKGPYEGMAILDEVMKAKEDPIVSAAHLDSADGSIIPTGVYHNAELKNNPQYKSGFVTKNGKWLDRKESEAHARATEQIDPSKPLESADGLHTKDIFGKLQEKMKEEKLAPEPPPKEVQENIQVQERIDAITPDDASVKFATREDFDKFVGQSKVARMPDPEMGQAKTVSQLAEHIFRKMGDDHYITRILRPLMQDIGEAGNLPVNVLDHKEWSNAINSFSEVGHIAKGPDGKKLPPEYIGGIFNENAGLFLQKMSGDNALVAAHEIGHAIFKYKLHEIEDLGRNHPKYGQYKTLLDDFERLKEDVRTKVDWEALGPEAHERMKYSLSNVHEFISDGLFTPTTMKVLFAIERQKPGIINRIVESVGKFFGLKKESYTAFHELLDMTHNLRKVDDFKLEHPLKVHDAAKLVELGEKGAIPRHEFLNEAWRRGDPVAIESAQDLILKGSAKERQMQIQEENLNYLKGIEELGYVTRKETPSKLTPKQEHYLDSTIRMKSLTNFTDTMEYLHQRALSRVTPELWDVALKVADSGRFSEYDVRGFLREVFTQYKGAERAPSTKGSLVPEPEAMVLARTKTGYEAVGTKDKYDIREIGLTNGEKKYDLYINGEKHNQFNSVHNAREAAQLHDRARPIKEMPGYRDLTELMKDPSTIDRRGFWYDHTTKKWHSNGTDHEFTARKQFPDEPNNHQAVMRAVREGIDRFSGSIVETTKAVGRNMPEHISEWMKSRPWMQHASITGPGLTRLVENKYFDPKAVSTRDIMAAMYNPNVRKLFDGLDPRNYGTDVVELKNAVARVYATSGKDAAVQFLKEWNAFKDTWNNPINEVDKLVKKNLYEQDAVKRDASSVKDFYKEQLPIEADRQLLATAIDAGIVSKLPPKMQAIALDFRKRMNAIGKQAMDNEVISGLIEDYVPHIVNWEGAPPGLKEQFLKEVLQITKSSATNKTTSSKFGEHRYFKTYSDLLAHLDKVNDRLKKSGSDWQMKLKTTDIAEIYSEYSMSMQRAISNKQLIEALGQVRGPSGEKMLNKFTKPEEIRDWKPVPSNQYPGVYVHPDLLPALEFVFDRGAGDIMNALGNVSQLAKRINVVASLFHAKSLAEVLSSTGIPIWTPIKELGLGAVDLGAHMMGKKTEFSGLTKALNMYRKGGLGDSIDQWQKSGMKLEHMEDVNKNIVINTARFGEQLMAKYGGIKTSKISEGMNTIQRYTQGKLDFFTWDWMHTGGKIMTAEAMLSKQRIAAAKKGIPFDDMAARTEISRFINRSFGGLNWFDEATQAGNMFQRKLQMAAYSPSGRRAMQATIFAPDWTLSTLRSFTSALPKELFKRDTYSLKSMKEGVKGMFDPMTKEDYARMYQFKTALTWFTVLNGLNMVTANRPIWDNKDPTRIEFPDGTSVQGMKHAMEPAHWIMDPFKTLSNKLGFLPKAAWVGLAGTEYAGPHADKLADQSFITGKLPVILSAGAPFQAQAAMSAPEGEGMKRAIAGSMGLPIYGSSKQQLKERRAEKSKAKHDAAKAYRKLKREKGW